MAPWPPQRQEQPPRADLLLVQEFVNSRDVEAGTDRLTSGPGWTQWATEHDLTPGRAPAADLARLVLLREAVREALVANRQGEELPRDAAQRLTDAARWAGVLPSFDVDGARLESAGSGPSALAGRVAAAVAEAMWQGTWSRLKACANDACRWAFYDQSRSRTGSWCSMQVCGNRAKQSRWRARWS